MQGNEFRINGVPRAAAGSAAICLQPGTAFKLLSSLGKKGLYSPWGSESCCNHSAQLHNERRFVSVGFSTYQISSGQPYFIRSSSVGIKVSVSKAQHLINNKSNYVELRVRLCTVTEQKKWDFRLPAPGMAETGKPGTPPSWNFEIF